MRLHLCWAAVLAAVTCIGAVLVTGHDACGHGIAGNRLFPGTLSFDDPAVVDEFEATQSALGHPAADRSAVVDDSINWEFSRLLIPNLALVVESGFIHRDWPGTRRDGLDTTTLAIKGLLYESDAHETLLSAQLSWGIGGSGTPEVGAGGPNTITPAIYFGKGFGDLPGSLGWLRPFAVTGVVGVEFPTASRSTALDVGNGPVGLEPIAVDNVDTLHWGFSVQYSTYYLTQRYTGGPPKEEPVNQFVPLVEFAFDTPLGQKTAANMSPGLAYVAETWQLAAEVVVPLNSEAGHGVGVRTQLLLFLDELLPSVFGKPLFRP